MTLASFDLSAVDWASAFGRLHPMLLHLPIGLIVALAILEFPHLFKRSAPVHDRPRTVLVMLLAVSALASATAGWLLHEEGGYGPPVEWHEWLGIGLAFLTIAIAVSYWRKSETYTLGVFAAFLLLLPTAHLGATMTHGGDFLTEPWEAAFADGSEGGAGTLASVESGEQGREDESDAPATSGTENEGPGVAQSGQAPVLGDKFDLVGGIDDEPLPGRETNAAGGAQTPEPTIDQAPSPSIVYADIAPLLKSYCTKCHGTRKHKGDLALHNLESILAGGEHGEVVVPGDPESSKLISSLHAPLDADEHMPPENKRQPSADAIRQLTLWVQGMEPVPGAESAPGTSPEEPGNPGQPDATTDDALEEPKTALAIGGVAPALVLDALEDGLVIQQAEGFVPFQLAPSQTNEQQIARYEAMVDLLSEPGPMSVVRELAVIPNTTNFGQAQPDLATLESLASHQVHVEVLSENSGLLRLDFTATSLGKESISSLIAPLAGVIGQVNLYGQSPTSDDLFLLGMMPNLTRLDLRGLRVQGYTFKHLSLRPLRASTSIASINLSGTPLSPGASHNLAVMQGLRRAHLWGAGILDDDVLRLAESRPDLELLGLGIEADPAIEVEPEVTFVRFVPEPGDEANSGAEADSPDTTPVPGNATCPVSDKPVDPAFTVVHEGRTIGFCCAKCPASFQADPAKYLAILDSK